MFGDTPPARNKASGLCLVLTGECTILWQNMILLCQNAYKEISLKTIGCI